MTVANLLSVGIVSLWAYRTAAVICILLTLFPLIRTGAWYIRCWDFPRLQLAFVAGVLTCVAVSKIVASGIRTDSADHLELVVWTGLLIACATWHSGHVIRFTPLWRRQVASVPDGSDTVHLVVANLKHDSSRRAGAVEELARLDADVLVLIEVNAEWNQALHNVKRRYPHRHTEVIGGGLGMALYSRFPLADVSSRFLIERDRPSIWATVFTGQGAHRLVAVHPTPPGLLEGSRRRDSRVRDAELITIAKKLASDAHMPAVVAGDFNDVAWSHTTRLFKRLSGLKDPRIGRSFIGTYHARCPLLRFPIDHAFFSDGFAVTRLDRHKIPGSDHFAISLRYRLIDSRRSTSPEPEGDDHQEAHSLVKEGKADAKEVIESK